VRETAGVEGLLAFAAIAAVIIVTPGPDTALTIRNTLLGGRTSGIRTALGVVTGQTAWTVATSAGVAALLVASEPAFRAVKLAGAAYLIFLGAQTLLRAVRGVEAMPAPGRRGGGAAYRQGLLSNLGNPKMAAFFTSLLPQFAPGGGEASFAGLLTLGLLFCAMTLLWLSAYAVAVARAGGLLRRTGIRRALDAVTGAVLVAFGLRLATDRR
jgi:threonine/homoserine/homoserine lactone efflux protein